MLRSRCGQLMGWASGRQLTDPDLASGQLTAPCGGSRRRCGQLTPCGRCASRVGASRPCLDGAAGAARRPVASALPRALLGSAAARSGAVASTIVPTRQWPGSGTRGVGSRMRSARRARSALCARARHGRPWRRTGRASTRPSLPAADCRRRRCRRAAWPPGRRRRRRCSKWGRRRGSLAVCASCSAVVHAGVVILVFHDTAKGPSLLRRLPQGLPAFLVETHGLHKSRPKLALLPQPSLLVCPRGSLFLDLSYHSFPILRQQLFHHLRSPGRLRPTTKKAEQVEGVPTGMVHQKDVRPGVVHQQLDYSLVRAFLVLEGRGQQRRPAAAVDHVDTALSK
eukprot:scaffold1172_cov247-Pinguiococcus_pyrenoidosus.AAC.15